MFLQLAVFAALMTLGTTDTNNESCMCSARCFRDSCYNAGGTSSVFLRMGRSIRSTNGRVKLIMQYDGDLAIYCYPSRTRIWHSNTAGSSVLVGAEFQSDANLVIYDYFNDPIWSADRYNNGGVGLQIQDDGNLVIYTGNGFPVWATKTDGRC